jgi:DNA polymerase-3 subunit epsilon/CBS domain-containing protein
VADRASATPLLSLDAVVFDTETTGLDPARAHLIEIGAIRLVAGRVEAAEKFHTLIDPGVPIPEDSIRIHGIDAARLKGAPDFTAAWPAFKAFLGKSPVIGHTIDYDLTIVANEAKRAEVEFAIPSAVDVRILAEIAKPNLPGFSIEHIAAWLGIEVEGRHSALGDAITTARIFAGLVPHLRERGIRTFAEAEAVCRKVADAMAANNGLSGALVAPPAPGHGERALARIDSYPYRHRIRDIMKSPPIYVAADMTLAAAMDLLMERRVSSLLVAPPGKKAEEGPFRAEESGILTERDVLRAVAKGGAAAITRPVETLACRPLAAVPAEAFIYRAIGRMGRLKIRHLGAVDEADFVTGILSARDLLRLRADEAISLGDEIDEAKDVHELGRAWSKLPAVARGLLAEEVDARNIAAVISRELGAITRRAAIIGEQRLLEAGEGEPPVPYAVLVLGSGGRGESLLAMDQDNAIVFEAGEPEGPEDRWFAKLGEHIADILHEVGVPYCKGGIMAKNAPWRGSARLWRERVAEWVTRSNPQDLLSVDIFFDLRAVDGDGAMAERLWRDALDMAKDRHLFFKLLAEATGENHPPVGIFGIKTDDGRVDLKRGGLFGIVSSARILALRYQVAERATRARIEGVKALDVGSVNDFDAWIDAHGVIVNAILAQQLVDIAEGRPPSNTVEVRRLSRAEYRRLRNALNSLKHLDETVRGLLTGR